MKNNKSTLFLDFDGLKFDTLNVHVEYINKRYGIKTTPADYKNNPGLDSVIKRYLPKEKHATINREEIYLDLGENLNGSIELHAKVFPIEGVQEILPLLAQKYTLWTVTARQHTSIPVIRHLLDIYVPNCISGIHCVWKHVGNYEFEGISKKEFISNFVGEKVAFIDDSLNEIREMQDIIPSYLFDPHGHNDSVKNVQYRVRSWEEIGKIFL